MQELLTVAIPTYNRESYLKEALFSIEKAIDYYKSEIETEIETETRSGSGNESGSEKGDGGGNGNISALIEKERVEIFISDNGSSDNTLSVIAPYHHILHPQNRGIDLNILSCIKESKGEYVFLFSDDDLLDETSISEIIKEIKKSSPSVICLNHAPFIHDDPNQLKKPFFKRKNKKFSQGEKFFKFAGLGFLSSLIVKREFALKYLDKIREGKECAHLDMVVRASLYEKGPCIFLRDTVVKARTPENVRYNPLKSCIIFQAEFLQILLNEKGIGFRTYKYLLNKLIIKDLFKLVLKARMNGEEIHLKEVLDQTFAEALYYRLFITPLYFFSRRVSKPIFYFLRAIYRLGFR